MKYLIKRIFYGFLVILFIIGYVTQFLWTLKKPTISFNKTLEMGFVAIEILTNKEDDDIIEISI